jgi:hypothetical protein
MDDRLPLRRCDDGDGLGTCHIQTGTWTTVLIAIFVLIGATLDNSYVVSTLGIIRDQT